MIATLIHKAFNEYQPETVAKIDVGNRGVMAALDYVYRVTQNIEGSWSKGEYFDDGTMNPDYNEDIQLTTMLERDEEGVTWGLRSTSMGDVIELQGRRYVVAMAGFKPEEEVDHEVDLF